MNAKKMIYLCDVALERLDDLEALLSHIPLEKKADRFIYTSMAAARELRHIARLETVYAVTVEQASHIQRILSKADFLLNIVPDAAKRELDGGQDSH